MLRFAEFRTERKASAELHQTNYSQQEVVVRVVGKAATVSKDERRRDEKKKMTVKGAPVKSVDGELVLYAFGGTNSKGLDVVSSR